MVKAFFDAAPLATLRVLNLTVLDRGLKMNVVTLVSKQKVYLDLSGNIPALANSDHISDHDVPEAGGQMDRHVLVPLLEPED